MAPVLKTGEGSRPPRVQIPLSPPIPFTGNAEPLKRSVIKGSSFLNNRIHMQLTLTHDDLNFVFIDADHRFSK